jgi:hypothetical protein
MAGVVGLNYAQVYTTGEAASADTASMSPYSVELSELIQESPCSVFEYFTKGTLCS